MIISLNDPYTQSYNEWMNLLAGRRETLCLCCDGECWTTITKKEDTYEFMVESGPHANVVTTIILPGQLFEDQMIQFLNAAHNAGMI